MGDKKGSFILLLSGFLLLSSCSFFRPRPHKLYQRALKEQPYDVIIVPGVPFNGKDWSMTMKARVIWAAYLVKNGLAKNVIFSGGAVYSPYVEARVMALYAQSLGVPRENIFIEEKAEHSTENIYYSYHLAKEKGFAKIAVASDPFQSNMLMGFTKRRFKKPISHIPFVIDTLAKIDDVFPTIVADSAYKKDFVPITQRQT
ncbi:MAG: YdcF family protein, partial [Bacteroidota bacterium]|nr:YdcF family protein [Bacteroidota bacterium]